MSQDPYPSEPLKSVPVSEEMSGIESSVSVNVELRLCASLGVDPRLFAPVQCIHSPSVRHLTSQQTSRQRAGGKQSRVQSAGTSRCLSGAILVDLEVEALNALQQVLDNTLQQQRDTA